MRIFEKVGKNKKAVQNDNTNIIDMLENYIDELKNHLTVVSSIDLDKSISSTFLSSKYYNTLNAKNAEMEATSIAIEELESLLAKVKDNVYGSALNKK